MLELKACPKCGSGDMGVDRDIYGWFRQCIQCGFLKDLTAEEVESLKKRSKAEVVGAGARNAA